ncbi:MAG: hypothetical protein WB710_20830, partial [Stellaceae bacterium]
MSAHFRSTTPPETGSTRRLTSQLKDRDAAARRTIGKVGRRWRGLAGAWRRLRSRHSPLGLLFLLALVVGGIFLAMLPALYQAKTPGGSTPRAFLAKAAAVPARAMPAVRPGTPSR